MSSKTQDFISIAEAAVRLDLSERTIRRMIVRGDLPARRIHKRTVRIPVAALASVGEKIPTYRRSRA